jgi:hypothetical protein
VGRVRISHEIDPQTPVGIEGIEMPCPTPSAGPTRVFTHKMQLDEWRNEPVWRDPRRCVANLDDEPAIRGGLVDPRIGEAGRRFLAALLGALDDGQLAALFRAARADQRGGVDE